jgi:hypothetical protein
MDTFQYQYTVYSPPLSSSAAAVLPAVAPLNGQPREGANIVRRQNRSCDQCRKGKRKCDAVILRDALPSGTEEEAKEAIKGKLLKGKLATVG